LVYHYVFGFYLSQPYPANTFLFAPRYTFSDFYDVYSEAVDLNPYLGEKSGQFPFLILIGRLFTVLPVYFSYFLYLLFAVAAYHYLAGKYLSVGPRYAQATSIFVICFLSYPFLFTIDRGNIEFLVFLFLLIFLYWFEQKKYLWSTLPLAMAIAIKVFPIVFLALFIPEKKWKELFATLVITMGLTLGSLWLFQGGFQQNFNYLLHLSNFSNNHLFAAFTSLEPGANIQRGVAIVSLVKIILGNGEIIPSDFWIDNFKLIYMIIAALMGGLTIFHVILKLKVLWKKVAICVFLMLLLPPISGEYKLIHLYLPIFLFINENQSSNLDKIYLSFFSILMIPKDYYIFPNLISDAWINNQYQHDISIGMPINICLLIIFTVLLLVSNPFEKPTKHKPISALPNSESIEV
jgi:hypothetical protein